MNTSSYTTTLSCGNCWRIWDSDSSFIDKCPYCGAEWATASIRPIGAIISGTATLPYYTYPQITVEKQPTELETAIKAIVDELKPKITELVCTEIMRQLKEALSLDEKDK